MARRPSQTFDPLTEVRSTKAALDHRWRSMTTMLRDMLGLSIQEILIFPDTQADRVWAGLQGNKCERTSRNRGGAANVVPLCELPKSLVAWLGFQEVWDIESGFRPYIFRQLSLTIHFGFIGDPLKPQAFRLEWPGIRDWSGAGLTFQTPGAGHPHWQFDILESLSKLKRREEAGKFEPEDPDYVEEFDAEDKLLSIDECLASLSLESIHFASAAKWWLPKEAEHVGQHMNAPPDAEALSLWVSESLRYVKQELGRCYVR